MINIKNISIEYDGAKLLRPQDLSFSANGTYLITGPNGSGKTSLVKNIAGRLKKEHKNVKTAFMSALQYYERTLPLTGEEFFKLYSKRAWPFEEYLDFNILRKKLIREMSSGEFQSLVLISHFNTDSKAIILDEPFSHLSPEWSDFFYKKMVLLGDEKLFIFVSHQTSFLSYKETRHWEIKDRMIQEVSHELF